MGPFGVGVGPWVLVAIALVIVVLFAARTASSIRLIAHRPPASTQALALHDRAAGSLGRAIAALSYVVAAMASSWWEYRATGIGGSWALAIAAVVTVLALMVIKRRWPVPGGTVRSADVQRRRLPEVLPRAGIVIAGAAVLLFLGSVVAGGLINSASNFASRSGTATGHGWPWPGWWRTAPLWIGIIGVSAVAALAIALLLRRPALAGFDRGVDLGYRRAGVDRVLRVLSCYCFIAASDDVNDAKNVMLGPNYQLGSVLNWVVAALLLASVVSVEIFRARPPRAAAVPGSSNFLAATR
jgi:hypothetical protein